MDRQERCRILPSYQIFSVDSTLYMKEVSRTGQNMIFSSSANQNMQEGLKKNSLSTIVDAFTIAAFNKDSSAVVVDMTSYFVSHTEDMNPFSSGKRTMNMVRVDKL